MNEVANMHKWVIDELKYDIEEMRGTIIVSNVSGFDNVQLNMQIDFVDLPETIKELHSFLLDKAYERLLNLSNAIGGREKRPYTRLF